MAPDVLELANLASEATLLASKPLADLLNEFLYDFPDDARQGGIWNEFQNAARAELEVDRVQSLQRRHLEQRPVIASVVARLPSDHLIRRLFRARPLPAHTPVDLVEGRSLVRGRQQR